MRIETVRARMVLTIAGTAVVLSGCSSNGGSPQVAGAGGGAAHSSAPADQRAIRQAWVDCMHAQGQTTIKLTADGQVLMPASGPDSGPGPAYDTAVQTCNAKVPGFQQSLHSGDSGAVDAARKFVACARKNGYADIPDPDPGTGAIVFKDASSFDQAKWDKAVTLCPADSMPAYRIGR